MKAILAIYVSIYAVIYYHGIHSYSIEYTNLGADESDTKPSFAEKASNYLQGIFSGKTPTLLNADEISKEFHYSDDQGQPMFFWQSHPTLNAKVKQESQENPPSAPVNLFFGKDNKTIIISRPKYADFEANDFPFAVSDGAPLYRVLYSSLPQYKTISYSNAPEIDIHFNFYRPRPIPHWSVRFGDKEVHVQGHPLKSPNPLTVFEGFLLVSDNLESVSQSISNRTSVHDDDPSNDEWQVDETAKRNHPLSSSKVCTIKLTPQMERKIWKIIKEESDSFLKKSYNFFKHNCYTFAVTVAKRLCQSRFTRMLNIKYQLNQKFAQVLMAAGKPFGDGIDMGIDWTMNLRPSGELISKKRYEAENGGKSSSSHSSI